MSANFSKHRCPQRQAIIDAEEFIKQCQKDGLIPEQVIHSMLGIGYTWDDVEKFVVGDIITKKFK